MLIAAFESWQVALMPDIPHKQSESLTLLRHPIQLPDHLHWMLLGLFVFAISNGKTNPRSPE
jgi:hypothetical protein